MLDGTAAASFRILGVRFRAAADATPTSGAAPRRREPGVVRNAAQGLLDWARGLAGAPRDAAETAGAQLTAPVHVLTAWRRGGGRAAEAQLRREGARQLAQVRTTLAAAEALSERAARFTPGTMPLVVAADIRHLGAAGALDRHVYEVANAAPDAWLGSLAAARRLADAEALAERTWVASAPNAAQAARLADDLARREAWATTAQPRVIAGCGAAPFRDVDRYIERFGGTPEDWVKLSARPYRTADGRLMETHYVQDLRTGRIHDPKEKPVR